MFTIGKSRRTQQSFNEKKEILLSGIVIVTYNNKLLGPRFIEVVLTTEPHNDEKRAALFIYKSRDKKRTETAIDLSEAKILVETQVPHQIGTICRENRSYKLELDKDKEDLERFAAQWRSMLLVAENPADIFSVVTLSGSRGAVLLITARGNQPLTFKYMSGPLKDTQFQCNGLRKVQRLGTLQVMIESSEGDIYDLINKRCDSLYSKFEERLSENTEAFPTKSYNNNASLYASRHGYTPADKSVQREVAHVPDDYMTMNFNRNVPSPGAYKGVNGYPPEIGGSNTPARPPVPNRVGSLGRNQRPVPAVPVVDPDYIPYQQQAESQEDDYLAMNSIGSQDFSRGDTAFEDPFIADYLTMESIQKSDPIPDIVLSDEADDGVYWDPSLVPPPRPPRSPNASFNRGSSDRPQIVPRQSRVRSPSPTRALSPPPPPIPDRGAAAGNSPLLPPRYTARADTQVIEASVPGEQQRKPSLPPKTEVDRLRKPTKRKQYKVRSVATTS